MSGGGTAAGAAPVGRLKKPSWKDPRLLVGLLLVSASVAAVVALVGSADQTTDVYAAKNGVSVGQELSAGDLVSVPVRLGELQEEYFAVAEGLPPNLYAQRLIGSGELVARSAVAEGDALNRKPVGFTVDETLPAEAAVGSRVDVWVSSPAGEGRFEEPELLLSGAEIAELSAASSALGASTSTALHILVTDEQLPNLLGALSDGTKLAVVWNPGAGS